MSATPDILTTRFGSRARGSGECPSVRVFWILKRCQSTELSLWYRLQSQSSRVHLVFSLRSLFIHSSWVLTYNILSSNTKTDCSVCNLHIIATPTEVYILLKPIQSTTSASGILEIPHSSPYNELYCLNLVHQNLHSGQAWNPMLVARYFVYFRLANWTSIW